MKTAEEKAAGIMSEYQWGRADDRSLLHGLICRAIKEQDRDTRLACMSAVSQVISAEMRNGGTFPLGAVSALDLAIMNAMAC